MRFIFLLLLLLPLNLNAAPREIIVASTTSTYDTGLLSYLNFNFEKKFGIKVKVIAVGTGQALRVAKDGNVEVLLVHHKNSELEFINQDYGLIRYDLMYNDYILLGPINDNIKCTDIREKLIYIFSFKKKFISRGDDSGTHKKEIELWQLINKNHLKFEFWYADVGQGMGNALLIANEMSAYILSDRSTWISFNKKDNLKIICQNSPPLINQYGLILINPKINENLNIKDAKIYIKWLLSNEGKRLINSFYQDGKQLFFYNYRK